MSSPKLALETLGMAADRASIARDSDGGDGGKEATERKKGSKVKPPIPRPSKGTKETQRARTCPGWQEPYIKPVPPPYSSSCYWLLRCRPAVVLLFFDEPRPHDCFQPAKADPSPKPAANDRCQERTSSATHWSVSHCTMPVQH